MSPFTIDNTTLMGTDGHVHQLKESKTPQETRGTNTRNEQSASCTSLSDDRVKECLDNLQEEMMEHKSDECTSRCLIPCCVSTRFIHCMSTVSECDHKKINSLLNRVYGRAYVIQSNGTCDEYTSISCFLFFNDSIIAIFVFWATSLVLLVVVTVYMKLSKVRDECVTLNAGHNNESPLSDANSVCSDETALPATPPPTYAKALNYGDVTPPPTYDEARVRNQLSSLDQLPHVSGSHV